MKNNINRCSGEAIVVLLLTHLSVEYFVHVPFEKTDNTTVGGSSELRRTRKLV